MRLVIRIAGRRQSKLLAHPGLQRGQLGLEGSGNDWVSFHRGMGRDRIEDGVLLSGEGTSEVPMRHQFATWLEMLEGGK